MSEIKKVGILGSGIMGSGLAEVAAKAGFDVVLRSRTKAAAEASVAAIDKGFAKAIERGKATEDDRAATMARIQTTDHLGALADCDLVIESVVEDLAVKKALFEEPSRSSSPRASSPPTPAPCRWWRWRWSPSGRTRCAASTSSTRRR